MAKTDKQELLEAHREKDIKTIISDVLNGMRGEKNIPNKAATNLGVSQATFYQWCQQWGINLDDYRQQTTEEPASV